MKLVFSSMCVCVCGGGGGGGGVGGGAGEKVCDVVELLN